MFVVPFKYECSLEQMCSHKEMIYVISILGNSLSSNIDSLYNQVAKGRIYMSNKQIRHIIFFSQYHHSKHTYIFHQKPMTRKQTDIPPDGQSIVWG